MNRQLRSDYLSTIRQTDPQLLIAIYRAATDTPRTVQMPRGLGFSGMIEAILNSEFAGADALVQYSIAHRKPTEPWPLAPIKAAQPRRRRTPREELQAFCSGAALVCTGLLMAGFYLLVKSHLPV